MAETAEQKVRAAHEGKIVTTLATYKGIWAWFPGNDPQRIGESWEDAASTLPPTAAEPSEPKADGFDEEFKAWWRESGMWNMEAGMARRDAAKQAAEHFKQSGVRKGMQRALDRLPSPSSNDEDTDLAVALSEARAAILAAMEECQ